MAELQKKRSIIIADDNSLMRSELPGFIIKKFGNVHISCVTDGIELMNAISEHVPDLIIMDAAMPKIGGMQASRIIKEQYPNTKILVFTAHKMEDIEDTYEGIGIDAFCSKVDTMDDFLGVVSSLIGKAA